MARIPISRAVIWILLSTVMISGSAGLGLLYYQHIHALRKRDAQYQIRALVQTGPYKEQLATSYIAKWIGLDLNKPHNIYEFPAHLAEKKLLSHPLIKQAEVKKVRPGTIYVDYTVRRPMAILVDYSNTLMDVEGVLVPWLPFIDTSRMPEIVLGKEEREYSWGEKVQGERLDLLFDLYMFILEKPELGLVRRMDVSQATAASFGQRQVVVEFEDHILRLSTRNYEKELERYTQLRDQLSYGQSYVIDFRVPQLAFVINQKIGYE